jgi:hypothetical protein
MKVKYVGNENGLFVSGVHFTKDKITEIGKPIYDYLFKKYTHEFMFLTEVPEIKEDVGTVFEEVKQDENKRKQGRPKKTRI